MKKTIFSLYPFLIILIAVGLCAVDRCRAGRIRTVVLSQEKPTTVTLAIGKATRISFPEKPEKLAPGSPGHLTIDYVTANDISIIPLTHDVGNLHIYTSTGDFVILFELGTSTNYDDAVNTRFKNIGRPLRLLEDTFHVEKLQLSFHSKAKSQKDFQSKVPVIVKDSNTRFEGPELFDALKNFSHLRCHDCVLTKNKTTLMLACIHSFKELQCEDSHFVLTIGRSP